MSTEMKKLIIGGTEYEIVDESGRTRISALEQGTIIGGGLSQIEKDYLLELFEKAAYAENNASAAFNALSALWADSTVYHAIAWSGTGYTKGNAASRVEDGAAFTSTITANTGFNITAVAVTMGGNTVQGAWSNGTVTIPNVTGDIVITVTTSQITVSSISAVYTQSGTVYDTDSLDSLKSDLVVTATFADSSTGVIAAEDYTLSGTLTVGTSTVTVNYAGLTATFSVTVTSFRHPLKDGVYETSNGQYRFTITNGYHCKAEVIRSENAVTNFTMLNCHTGEYSISDSSSVNNLSAIFTLPANKAVTLNVKNVVNSASEGTQLVEFIVLLRNANATTSFLATAQSTHTTDQTATATPSSDTGIGAVGFGVNGKRYSQGAYVEFDIELIVGNDIYIGDAT